MDHEEIFLRSRRPEYSGIYPELAAALSVTRQTVHNSASREVALKLNPAPILTALDKLMKEWDKAAAVAAAAKEKRTAMLRRKAS